jgi:GNAT superfamily N-acetyltransferase
MSISRAKDTQRGLLVRERDAAWLENYARMSIAFEVRTVFDVRDRGEGLGGFELVERPVDPPFVKDYDAGADNRPLRWARRFDLSNWGVLSAELADEVVGGAVIAFDTPGVDMLEGRRDLAVLWDLRVDPRARRRGVGAALFRKAERWARERECRQMKIETQNINVVACKFYVGQGCKLGAVDRFAYPKLPDEVRLLWYKDLA